MQTMINLQWRCSLGLAFILATVCGAAAQQEPAPPAAKPAPPPAAPAKRSAADLAKLVAPIALYPDPLIATLLPASVYPLEIVQAARFVANTNNLAKLDDQPWDENVKAVARVPALIQKMDADLSWTSELGEAFLAQDKDVMDAIQALRNKAEKAGTLQTTPQQIVSVTNMIVEKTVEQKVVVVTNTIVQIQPTNPQVVYVPTYNPYTVYYPPPAYVYNPVAPLVTFGVGVAVGAIIANNCDWRYGGCYHSDVNINVNNNYNRNVNNNVNRATTTGQGQKWQPDQSRLNKSGTPASAQSREARGWDSGGARASTQPAGASRPTPSTGAGASRPSAGTAGTRPSTGTPSASRPAASPSAGRPSPSSSASRPSSTSSFSRPSGGSSGSAFGGVNSGSSSRSASSRGAASRGGGGGGGRGGGGRGR